MDSKSGTGWRPGSSAFASASTRDSAEAREPEDVEDIFGGGGSADDVAGGWTRRRRFA